MRFQRNALLLSMATLLSVAAVPAQAQPVTSEISESKFHCVLIIDARQDFSQPKSTKEYKRLIDLASPCAPSKAEQKLLRNQPDDGIQRTKPMVKKGYVYSHSTRVVKSPADELSSPGEKPMTQKPTTNYHPSKK